MIGQRVGIPSVQECQRVLINIDLRELLTHLELKVMRQCGERRNPLRPIQTFLSLHRLRSRRPTGQISRMKQSQFRLIQWSAIVLELLPLTDETTVFPPIEDRLQVSGLKRRRQLIFVWRQSVNDE